MQTLNQYASAEIVQLADGMDHPAGGITRKEMRANGLLHRVTYILVFNCAGEILVQTRTRMKDWYPGRHDLAAGGVVVEGENYMQSAQRELREELGIAAPLQEMFGLYFEDRSRRPRTRSWGRVYKCVHSGPFELQAQEVAAVAFMSLDQALSLPPDSVTPDTRKVLMTFLL